ncbi:peptide-methionine (S)-S-oxide reductase MsrA [Psychrosphaera haliotis]|nr:peptide-methionine (S)-S-oxide reductase MsrA [Psychrosphaera haliotis]
MEKIEIATFGGGCFWCIEAALNKVRGVVSATSGYSAGHRENPSYQQIITGTTGHAEVIQVEYDANVINYEQLLSMFFQLHDPTTLNRQGNDIGTQYRSIILYHDNAQLNTAQDLINKLNLLGIWDQSICTEIKQYEDFYPAEHYHQGYALKNPEQPYCAILIGPKLEEFEFKFKNWLK